MTDSVQKIVIIGGGPGGYVAAIRAAQLGAKVTLIEKEALGGTCLNRGCVPTKFLIQAADMHWQARHAQRFGMVFEGLSIDFTAMMKEKAAVVRRLCNGVGYLMQKGKIDVVQGTGTILGPNKVRADVSGKPAVELTADTIIIATGSVPIIPPIDGAEGKGVITSDHALAMKTFPASITIIGGGVIGVEFAQIFNRLNTKTTIIEMMPGILPGEHPEISAGLEKQLRSEGIEIYTAAQVTGIVHRTQREQVVRFKTKERPKEAVSELVLMAVGRKPCLTGLGVEACGIRLDGKGCVAVDQHLETSIGGIYAIGDAIGGSMLAHTAMAEGICAVENVMGQERAMDYTVVPRCVYSSPEVAGVGLTEDQAKAEYGSIKVGHFPFISNSKAVIGGDTEGMVKVIAEAEYDQVVGVSIVGPHATELIAQAGIAINLEATLDEVAETIVAHPTLSEAVAEAALNALGQGLHM